MTEEQSLQWDADKLWNNSHKPSMMARLDLFRLSYNDDYQDFFPRQESKKSSGGTRLL